MAFKVIETQEQFDELVMDRIGQAKDSVRKEFEGWISPEALAEQHSGLQTQIEQLTTDLNAANEQIAQKDGIIRTHETNNMKIKVAHEAGLSYEAVQFLQGTDEDSIKASATALKSLTGMKKAPQYDPEPAPKDAKNAALKNMLKEMKGE